MSNIPYLIQAVGTFMDAGKDGGAGGSGGLSHEVERCAQESNRPAINHRYDKLHPTVRPYAMMTRTGYMEYDLANSRGVIPGIYARCIAPVIGNTVFLQDINLNQVQVVIERTKTEMYFTHGWACLRDLYKIGPGDWITLLYINPFLLHIRIRSIAGVEITYPLKSPPYRLMLDKDFKTGAWDAPIPFFVLPKVYSHRLEKTLTAADIATRSLTLCWGGFCENALPHQDTLLTLIDWLGNAWKDCHLQLDKSPPTSCKISGQWSDICKVHHLAADVVAKFGVTQASNNKIMYLKLSPFLGVRTTLYAPSTSGDKKTFYQSQCHFML